ncbi:PREDICTED: facilitated trehalose transporter Tret1-like [Nicrophorus vespilloides]|uniref:Facilitated trehalose transporter Tret1-like n=1 Tax=Nicrophorus vespilloides TaxID=110193 RepID=A0ABM1MEJ4_NICVS|nr:PREDICTED: facilitated trehalose transporter Tret1-like [Nicrophorus vespilloides]
MANRIVQFLAMVSGSFLPLTCGINLGWPSPFLPKLQEPDSQIPMNSDEASWVAVMPLIGGPFGAFLGALLVDKLGRKNLLLTQGPLIALSFLIMAFFNNIWVLCVIRFIVGSAEGAIYTALPIYYGEIADPKIRGILGSSLAVSALMGNLLINVIGSYLSLFWSSIISGGFALIHFFTFVWMPESPYFLIKKGLLEEAKASLTKLRGEFDTKEFDEIKNAVKRQEACEKSKFLDLVTVKSNRKAMGIFIILTLTNKVTGMTPVMFYTVKIFTEADGILDPVSSVFSFNMVGLIGTILALFIIDRFGRRPLMLFSAFGCCFALLGEAIFFMIKIYLEEYLEYVQWLPLVSLMAFNLIFCLGLAFGPVLFLSELFPTSVKANALGAAETISVTLGTAISKIFHYLTDAYGMVVPFWSFAVCTALAGYLIFLVVPETKGKTLEEIQLDLIGQRDDEHREKQGQKV